MAIAMTWIMGHFFAIGIGVSLGLLGGGGSILALPVLVYVMGLAPRPAIAMTLIIVGTVSLLGSISHWRRGNLNFRVAGIFGSTMMLGAFLGARLATLPFVTETFQMVLFGITMLVAAVLMVQRTNEVKSLDDQDEMKVSKYRWLWIITEGLGVGGLTGLVGVGGGFAIIPTLVLLANVPMRQAVGTSLLIITGKSVAGFIGYLGQVELDWHLTASFTFLAGCGTVIGTYLGQFVSTQHLQKSFAYFLILVAVFVLGHTMSRLIWT